MKLTPAMRAMLAALDRDGDMEPREIAATIGVHLRTIERIAQKLRDAELVRVAVYLKNSSGPAIPVYSVSPGKNAKRPRRDTYREARIAYQTRLAERGGRQYLFAKQSLNFLCQGFRK